MEGSCYRTRQIATKNVQQIGDETEWYYIVTIMGGEIVFTDREFNLLFEKVT